MPAKPGSSVPRGGERAQASVALIATVPALVVAAAVLVQLAAIGWSAWSAAGAARAAARAEQVGDAPEVAARHALPPALGERASTEILEQGGRVRVEVRAPRLMPLIPTVVVGAAAALDPAATSAAEGP